VSARPIAWRRNLYALWLAQLLTIIGFSLRTPFLPFFLADIGADSFASQAIWSGAINAGGAAVMAISAPFWGIVADRYGRRPMVLRAMFAGSVTVSLMGLAQSPLQLLILRFIEGGFTGTVAASTTLVASTTPREQRGFSLGMMQMAVFSGASIGPLFGGLLADFIGYRVAFVVAGAMLFTGGLIVLTQVREDFQRPRHGEQSSGNGAPTLWVVLLGGAMLAMIGVMVALRLSTSAVQPIMPLYVEQLAGATGSVATLSGLTLGVAGLSSAVAAVLIGRKADRIGHGKVLMLATLAAGLLFIPLGLAQASWQLIIFNGLYGIAAGGVMPSANSVIANLTPAARRGAVFGFTTAATSLGGFIGPLGGALLAATYDIRYVFFVAGGITLLAAGWVAYTVRSGAALELGEET
jgi:DHA1 family multidrug resistance protein-like MFS transporter